MSSTYEKFIAANHALFKCMESVSAEQVKAMSPAEQNQVCHAESQAVAHFLQNDSVNFKSLVNERLQQWQ